MKDHPAIKRKIMSRVRFPILRGYCGQPAAPVGFSPKFKVAVPKAEVLEQPQIQGGFSKAEVLGKPDERRLREARRRCPWAETKEAW
jgi:hypothetical protein